MLACPRCGSALRWGEDCGCGRAWAEVNGVADLYEPDPGAGEDTSVSEVVQQFYEERPFPDYDAGDDLGSLVRKGRAVPFTRDLDAEIPIGARVVELGCGTGQMSLFLGVPGREVIGVDLTMASLQVAERFRKHAKLGHTRLVRGNVFRPPILRGSVDVAVSNGVLHHTASAERAFAVMASLVRPGGYVVLGLYNTFGRLLLPSLRRRHRAAAEAGGARAMAWFHDQHQHPRETRHTVDEVLGWFSANGLDFVSARPTVVPGAPEGPLFTPAPPGAWWEHQLAQLGWLGRAADGGLFVMVGRKR